MNLYNIDVSYKVTLEPKKTYYDIEADTEKEAEKIALKKISKEDEGDLLAYSIEQLGTNIETSIDTTESEVKEVELIEENIEDL